MTLSLKIPPVAVALSAGAGMAWVDRMVPAARMDVPGRRYAVVAVSCVALLLATDAVVRFVRARTTIWPERPERTSALVTSGIYRVTRNPMYLGLAVLLGAWAVHLGNPVALVTIPLFVGYMTRYQIIPEEEALIRRFGAGYRDYCSHVRRWL